MGSLSARLLELEAEAGRGVPALHRVVVCGGCAEEVVAERRAVGPRTSRMNDRPSRPVMPTPIGIMPTSSLPSTLDVFVAVLVSW